MTPGSDSDGAAGTRASRRRAADSVTADLGDRLRALRQARGLSLRSVASKAQISPSLLSAIERGEASPSLVSLVALADALVVRPGALLDDDGTPSSETPVVRQSDRRVIDDELCRREYMMHLDDPYLEVAELTLPPGGSTRPALASHSGRDYGIVLDGEVVVEFTNGQEALGRGDYIAFDADRAHRVVNASEEPARVLWMIVHGDRSSGPPGPSQLADPAGDGPEP